MDDQKSKCPNHPDKPCAFYCFAHSIAACLKCAAAHIECQVKNQFQPLEEVFEILQQKASDENNLLSEKLQASSSTIQENENKLFMLDNLRDLDLQIVGDFFEDLKKKIDVIKVETLQNYRIYYDDTREKVSANNNEMKRQFEREAQGQTKVQKLQDHLKTLSNPTEKRDQAMISWGELEKIKKETCVSTNLEVVDFEIQSLMSKDYVLSEISSMTSQYSKILPHVSNFVKEYMKEHLAEPQNAVQNEEFKSGSLDERISKIDYLKEQGQVYEKNFIQALEDPREIKNNGDILHQLRYCSNELNIFTCKTGTFTCYELFTTNSYKTPFLIFNNCGSALYENHLIFLFGGEDPGSNDKSSNRVFCLNLNKAMNRKLVVYEICPMSAARQEFTLSAVGQNIFLISGYDSNKPKENRVIPKCERLDLKSRRFCDMRNIDYPRHAACSVNVNNTHIYVFGGQNPKYLNHYVDKIERYTINLDDWSSLKYSVMNEFVYEPGLNSTAFRINEGDIVILGGKRGQDILNGYYVFDMKKLLMVKKEEGLLKEADNFYNQNNVEANDNKCIQLFSSNKANYIYEFKVKDPATYSLSVDVIQDINCKDVQ